MLLVEMSAGKQRQEDDYGAKAGNASRIRPLRCALRSEILGGLDGDAPARAVIKQQDRLIAEKSGNPVLVVKSIYRSGSR